MVDSDEESINSNDSYTRCKVSKASINGARKQKQLLLPTKIEFGNTTVKTVSFVDSGADNCFVSNRIVEEYQIPLERLDSQIELVLADGKPAKIGPITHRTLPVQVIIGEHVETRVFLVADLSYDVILGLNWLRKHDPRIIWSTFQCQFNSEHCLHSCVDKVHTVQGLLKEREEDVNVKTTTTTISSTSMRARHFIKKIKEEKELYGSFFIKRDGRAGNKYKIYSANVPAQALFSEDKKVKESLHPIAQQLMKEFPEVFSESKAEMLPEHRVFDCDIPLIPGAAVPYGRVYQLTEPERKALETYVNTELAKGYIRYSTSPAGAPCFFVKKKDGSLRLCVDFRGLNKLTVKNRYPIPLIAELIRTVAKGKIYTALDLKGAYNLVRVKEGDEWKTAFRTPFGHFEYLVMPFGLTNAPSIFQSMMDKIFRDLIGVYVVVYLDDILIFSENEEEHANHVREVLRRLSENKLYCKLSKCTFFAKSIPFLGHVISAEGVSMDPEKVRCVQEWPVPTSVVEIQSFLGLANYYRSFIPSFSELAIPLTTLTKKNVPFVWGELQQKAFESLKKEFDVGRVLAHPDISKPFVLETDASDVALGGVLSQYEGDVLRPVAFYARQLAAAERNYEIYDKELLAVVECCKQWRHFLQGAAHTTTIITDHENLKYFKATHRLTRRQARWSLFLSEFDFIINHRPGKLHKAADALSRRADFITDDISMDNTNHNLATLLRSMYTQLAAGQTEEEQEFKELVKEATSAEFIKKFEEQKGFELLDGILFKDGLMCIPNEDLQLQVLRERHDSKTAGHFGISKTVDLVSRDFWWPGLKDSVTKYVKSCDCVRFKSARNQSFGPLQTIQVGEKPWSTISCDFIVALPKSEGFDAIAVWVCRTTKMAHFIPCNIELSAHDHAKLFIKNVFRLHGLPVQIISDRGPQFISKFWKAFCKELNIQAALSTAFHPQTDGQTERVNQTLEQYLRVFSNYYQDDWAAHLPLAEFAYNNMMNASTNFSPFFVNYGFHPKADGLYQKNSAGSVDYLDELAESLDALKVNLEKAQKKQAEIANRHRAEVPFQVGDLVWLSSKNISTTRPSKKLDYKRLGPFKITKQINPVAFELELPETYRIHNVFHASLLTPYVENEFANRTPPPPAPVEIDGELEYEVEEVIKVKKGRGGKYVYFVLWSGYSRDDATWEPLTNLENCLEKVGTFYNKHPNAKGLDEFLRFERAKRGGDVMNMLYIHSRTRGLID